jgi:hypothetical protein
MELNELKIGQWYNPINNSNWFYMPLKTADGIITKSIHFRGKPVIETKEGPISNIDFWQNCISIEFKDLPQEYQKLVPEEYRTKREIIPLIFN